MIHPVLPEKESASDFLSLNLFTKFLNYIEKTQNVKSCYANSHLINEHIIINFVELKYYLPYDYTKKLNGCKNVDYIIIPISLVYNNYSHYNIVIINNKKKTFEYFEPIGDQRFHRKPYFEVEAHIYGIITWIFDEYFDIPNSPPLLKNKIKNYKFVNAHVGCPIGLQKKQMNELLNQEGPALENGQMYKYHGLCVAWCLLIVHLRILNPDVKINYITKNLLENQELNKYIRQYVYLIENTQLNTPKTYIKPNVFNLKLTENEIEYNKNQINEIKGYTY